MIARSEAEGSYKYGFQGQEKDDEIAGSGNSYTAQYWQYDSRLGRRWNVDPIIKYSESPYAAFGNNPVVFIDPLGADTIRFNSQTKELTKTLSDGDHFFYVNDDLVRSMPGNEGYKAELSPNDFGGYDFYVDDERIHVPATIRLNRTTDTENSTIGTFTIDNSNISGFILEPSGPSTAESGQNKRIPSGTHNVEAYTSQKYPNVFIITSDQVAESRRILIHIGNYPSDTRGCLLPGASSGTDFVGQSSGKLSQIREYMQYNGLQGAQIIIVDPPAPVTPPIVQPVQNQGGAR